MYIEFEKWLNNILEENMPIPGAAINFNLYEEADLYWSIQLICASYFDEEDEDWCCDCLLYTSPSPRDRQKDRMPSSA